LRVGLFPFKKVLPVGDQRDFTHGAFRVSAVGIQPVFDLDQDLVFGFSQSKKIRGI